MVTINEPVVLRGKPAKLAGIYDSGYGDGYGGSGYGGGSGSGSGGYGYGSGDGSGDGYGGSKEYWISTIPYFICKWPIEQQDRLQALQQQGATIAFWRSDGEGRACNGGRHSSPVGAGTIEKIDGPLRVCSRNALHATFIPPQWKGERVWIVALIGETQCDGDKIGALQREIVGEALAALLQARQVRHGHHNGAIAC